jgi:hypothetical protein
MGDFDYVMPVKPLPKSQIDIDALFGEITDMEEEASNFIGGIYGPAGHGKTTVAMKLAQAITPPESRILYCFTGQNWNSLKNIKDENGEAYLMKRCKKYAFENMDKLRALIATLKRPDYRALTKIDTIVFDEYNTMFDIEVDDITVIRAADLMREKKIYKDSDTPEWPDYNTAKAHMVVMMNDIMQMQDMNVIFICHPRQNRKTFVTEPDFFDKAAQAFIRSLNSLYYLSVDEVNGKLNRKIILQGTDRLVAKNRIGGLPNEVPNIDSIVEAYKLWAPANIKPKPVPIKFSEEQSKESEAIESITLAGELPPSSSDEVAFDLDAFLSKEEY